MAHRALVVDDEEEIVQLIGSRLRAKGLEVVTAGDGEEALARLKEGPVDVVIADVTMPKVDGYSLILEMKKEENLKDIPVIMLTGKDQLEDVFRAEGVTHYLVKPFDGDKLLAKLNEVLPRS